MSLSDVKAWADKKNVSCEDKRVGFLPRFGGAALHFLRVFEKRVLGPGLSGK
jgi:hypothetical protein